MGRTAGLLGCALLVLVGLGPRLLLAQAAPPDARAVQARSAEFHARIRELARALANAPLLKGRSLQEREKHVEFVAANMIFVLIHELGHAVISEMDLPVLGQEEDAADQFAILTGLNVVANEYSLFRSLVNASRGWFLSARRDRKEGEPPDYYGRHRLDEQRAYHIVCLMVGSDPVKFKAVADEAKLPESRRPSCVWDYETATRSWQRLLRWAAFAAPPINRKPRLRSSTEKPRASLASLPNRFGRSDIWRRSPNTSPNAMFGAPLSPWRCEPAENPAPDGPFQRAGCTFAYELGLEFAQLYREYGAERESSRSARASVDHDRM